MHTRYLWLALWSHFAFQMCVLSAATDDQEHVHIKVHMPNTIRKQTRYRKIPKHNRHQKNPHVHATHYHSSHAPHVKEPIHQHYSPETELFANDHSILPQYIPMLSQSELITNQGPVQFANDILPTQQSLHHFQHPHAPLTTTPLGASTTVAANQMPLSKQLMHQLFTPEIASALTANGEANNIYTADEFATESHLLNDYNNKHSTPLGQRIRSERLTQSKAHKQRKKYANLEISDNSIGFVGQAHTQHPNPYQQQQQNQHQKQIIYPAPQQHYQNLEGTKTKNNNYYYYRNFNDNLNPSKSNSYSNWPSESGDESEEIDNEYNSSSSENSDSNGDSGGGDDDVDDKPQEGNTAFFNHYNTNPISYQSLYGAYTTELQRRPPTSAAQTQLNWRPYQTSSSTQQQFPSARPLASTPISPSLSSENGVAITTAAHEFYTQHKPMSHLQTYHQHHQRRKKRKNRIKTQLRERIVVP